MATCLQFSQVLHIHKHYHLEIIMRVYPRLRLIFTLLASVMVSTASPAYVQSVEAAVPMASGGVGEEEFDALAAQTDKFNVKLLFTESTGDYLSDVAVSIMTAKGQEIASIVTDGPILLIQLKPGTYKVKATEAGRVQEHKLVVGKGRAYLQVRFPVLETPVD